MARIRTVKPEMLDDEKVAALPHLAWRLFVSLIMTADDYGNQHGAPGKIRGSALWATDATDRDTREALARLSRDSLVALYTVRGQAYVSIVGWSKHQRVDKPGRPIVPGPEQADSSTSEDSRDSRETPENPRETLATDHDQYHDQEGEHVSRDRPATFSLVPDRIEPKKPKAGLDLAIACCDEINAATGSRYEPESDATLRLAAVLAKSGHTADDVRRVVVDRVDAWKGDAKMAKYLRPATILAAKNFAAYLDDLDHQATPQVDFVPAERMVY